MMNRMNPTVILVAVITVLGLLGGILLVGNLMGANEKTLQSTGTYKMTAQPDESSVYLSVQTKSKSSDEAKDKNAMIIQKVKDSLLKLGLDKSNLETQNFNIYPDYNWDNGKRVDNGFIATNSIKVRTKDFSLVGKIVDAAADEGALIDSINFELSTAKNNELKATALSEASKDARAKAEAIANGLGQKIGKIVSVSTSDYGYSPYPIFARAEGMDLGLAKQAATNIEPKNLDISATVNVVFEIK